MPSTSRSRRGDVPRPPRRTRSDVLAVLNRWPRRVLAGLCLVLAAASAVAARAPARAGDSAAPTATADVVVATRDLAAGTRLAVHDLRVARWPAGIRPAGALTRAAEAAGHWIAGPVRAGEALTPARLVGPGLTRGLPAGLTAISVTVPAGTGGMGAGLLVAGAHVDLLGTPTDTAGTAQSRDLGTNLLVLAVTAAGTDDPATGTVLVLAVDHDTARRIARCAACSMLALRDESP